MPCFSREPTRWGLGGLHLSFYPRCTLSKMAAGCIVSIYLACAEESVELGILLYLIAIVNSDRFQSCYVSLPSVELVKVVGDAHPVVKL